MKCYVFQINTGWFYGAIRTAGLLMIVLLIHNVHCFNIDVQHIKMVTGPVGSHFGYTLAFDEKASENGNISLLVGAPKEMTETNKTKIQTGAVHRCSYVADNLNCSTPTHRFPAFYKDLNSSIGEGYGSSLSISRSGKIVVCAPHWKDTNWVKRYGYVYVPGRCVSYTDDENTEENMSPYFHVKEEAKLYLPAHEYYHGFASFGFSADTAEASTFAFGSPGLTIFEGAIDIRGMNYRKSTTDKGYKLTLGTTAYGYLGYSIKFGKFCGNDICLAAGAPNWYLTGMVRLYRWKDKKELENFQNLEGDKSQYWTYFGSVLSAVDADNDNVDELLVGAPYYGDGTSGSFDCGRVFLYTKDKSSEYKQHLILDGSGNRYSRFGSAIQTIGDLNLDSYPDIVVGAPGEEDGAGCIYVYLGSQVGLSPKYTQRICAKELPGQGSQLKNFGSSISGTIKLQRNPYPAFAVSSFMSDAVVMFTSRVVVQVSVTLNPKPNPIDITKICSYDQTFAPCTVLEICLKQEFQGFDTKKIDFLANLELDTQRRAGSQQRVEVLDTIDTSGRFKESLRQIPITGVDENGFCQEYVVVTRQAQIHADRFTPIEIKVTIELDETSSSKDVDPILDPAVPTTFTEMVSIANNCSDNICNVDLSVKGMIVYSHKEDWPFVVVGLTKELQVDLTIFNSQEVSYGTTLTIEVDQPLRFIKIKSTTIKYCKPQRRASISTNSVVVCNYYQPLRKGSSLKVSAFFDTTDVAMDRKKIRIVAMAMPVDQVNSPERKKDDNRIEMTTSVYLVADVNVFGTSSPSEVTIKTAKRLSLTVQEVITGNFSQTVDTINPQILNHKFQMKNLGPSFLPKTTIYVAIPAYLPDASQLISDVSVELQFEEKDATSCVDIMKGFKGVTETVPITTTTGPSSSDGQSTTSGVTVTNPHSTTTTTEIETTTGWRPRPNPQKRRKRAADKDYSKTYFLTCDTTPHYCITFKCELESKIEPGGFLKLNVTFTVDKANVPIPEALTSTSTEFHLVNTGGKINIWIIIGSVIAGLVLILIIAIVCWKLGFFKRKKHYEVEEWKRKSIRMSRIPAAAMKETNGTEN